MRISCKFSGPPTRQVVDFSLNENCISSNISTFCVCSFSKINYLKGI